MYWQVFHYTPLYRAAIQNTMNLLIIEDDADVAKTIERTLRGGQFEITIASNGVEGLQKVRRLKPDIIILDIIMPKMDGLEVCRAIRSDPMLSEIPILFLTAKAKDEDRIAGLLAGGDDYLVKPFNIDELVLRIQAILRRVYRPGKSTGKQTEKSQLMIKNRKGLNKSRTDYDHQEQIAIGKYTLYLSSYQILTPDKGIIRLTPVQYDLLYHLMTHAGEIFSPARLLDEVWDYPADAGSPDLVRVHIKNLRERIEVDPKKPVFIRTVAGFGYTISNK